MLVLSKCPTILRWTLLLRCSVLPLRSATPSSQRSTTTGPQIVRTQTALFHQSEAKASPELNKPSTGKNIQPADNFKSEKSSSMEDSRRNVVVQVKIIMSRQHHHISYICSLLPPHSPVLSSGTGLDVELFGMGLWSLGLGAIGAAVAGIFLANTDLCLPKMAKAPLEYLEDADLLSTTEGGCSLFNNYM